MVFLQLKSGGGGWKGVRSNLAHDLTKDFYLSASAIQLN